MRAISLRLIACALLAHAAAVAAGQTEAGSVGEPEARLVWMSGDGETIWTAPLGTTAAKATPEPDKLTARAWFPPLPSVELQLDEGGRQPLRSFAGKVLILDFWATWCEPCAEELPLLQALRDAEAERGLEVVAVNMQEPPATARQFFWALNLRLPIARYDQAVDDAFGVKSLPTVIVADRRGRVRARWDGFQPGLDERIAELVRELLGGTEQDNEEQLAEVLVGRGRFEPRWSRPSPRPIDGLALVPGEGPGSILVSAGRELLLHDAEGRIVRRWSGTRSIGELRAGDPDGKGRTAVFGTRRGSTRIVPVDLTDGAGRGWEAPAPVLDAELLPTGAAEPEGELVLATTSGIHRVRIDGTLLEERTDLDGVIDIAVVPANGSVRLALLDTSGRLGWLERDLTSIEDRPTGTGQTLIPDHGSAVGVGLASVAVAGSTRGRLLGGGEEQLALALQGQLVLLDLASGRERFRARWPDVSGLVAGDLDQDGLDELIVVSGQRLTVLHGVDRPDRTSP